MLDRFTVWGFSREYDVVGVYGDNTVGKRGQQKEVRS
jgi:hypothetical protein